MTISLGTPFQWLTTLSVKHLFLIWFWSELPLMELHSISSCPITGHQTEKISTFPSTAFLEEDEGWDGVFPHLFLFQAPTNQVTLAASYCLSPSWSTFSEWSLIVSCSSYIKDSNINVKSLEQFVQWCNIMRMLFLKILMEQVTTWTEPYSWHKFIDTRRLSLGKWIFHLRKCVLNLKNF